MIPAFAITAWRWFAGGNWKWAVPTAIAVVLGIYAGAQRINYLDCKADRTADQLAHRDAIIAQKNKDRALADEIIAGQAQTIAQLAQKTSTHTEIIRNVPVTTACPAQPAMRAADDGLLDLGFKRATRPAAGVNAPKTGGAETRPR
jgi:hypothetical protein